MATRFAKRFDKEVRATVDDFGVIAEVGLGVDHAEQFDHRLDGGEFANRRFCDRQQLQAGEASRPVAIVDRSVLAQSSDFKRSIGLLRSLAGEKQKIARPAIRTVGGEGSWDRRQRQAQNHRTVLVNLDKIIASLHALHPKGADDD